MQRVRSTRPLRSLMQVPITVKRVKLVQSASKALGRLRNDDWFGILRVTYDGEPGCDAGGLAKDLFMGLSTALLQPSDGGMFAKVGGAGDAPTAAHPNKACTTRSADYEFAGKVVGKMLLDVGLGRPHQCPVRLSRALRKLILGATLGNHPRAQNISINQSDRTDGPLLDQNRLTSEL